MKKVTAHNVCANMIMLIKYVSLYSYISCKHNIYIVRTLATNAYAYIATYTVHTYCMYINSYVSIYIHSYIDILQKLAKL